MNVIGTISAQRESTIRAELDWNGYAAGRKARREQVNPRYTNRDAFRGEWNYSLESRSPNDEPHSSRVLTPPAYESAAIRLSRAPQHLKIESVRAF